MITLFKYAIFQAGGVAEWTKAAALKAVEGPVPSVGSNPTPSAKHCTRPPRARHFTHPDPGAPRRAAVPWDGGFSRGLARAGLQWIGPAKTDPFPVGLFDPKA